MISTTRLIAAAGVCALVVAGGCGDVESFAGAAGGGLSVEEVVFDDTALRTERRLSVMVQNTGRVAITDIQIEIHDESGEVSEVFFVEEVEVPHPLNVGESFVLPLIFRPTELKEYTGTLNIFFNDPRANRPSVTASIRGKGVERASCQMTLVDGGDFGEVEVGQSKQGTLEVRNDGDRACTLSGVRVSQEQPLFEILLHPTQLAAGEVAEFILRFTPTMEGQIHANLQFVASEIEPSSGAKLETEVTIPLAGEGYVEPLCALEPFPVAVVFPRAVANAPHAATLGQFVVRNVGNVDCTIDTVTITAGEEHFALDNFPPTGSLLVPEASTPFSVQFAPVAVGQLQGELTITTLEGDPLVVPLNALADPDAVCSLAFSPSPVVFPPVGVGLSQTQTVTITNLSVVDCNIADIQVVNEASSDFTISTLPLPTGLLGPGSATTVNVVFTPTTGAPANATLEVDYGDAAPAAAPMLGFGAYAELKILPLDWLFGYVTEGCASPNLPIRLFNVSDVPARLDSIGFSAYSDPNFEVIGAPAPGTFLAGGQEVVFQARVVGSDAYGGNRGELMVHATGASRPIVSTHLFGESESKANAGRTQVFLQDAIPAVDILFVIDNSGSMSSNQQNLANNIQAFIQFFASDTAVDFHIGVTSTDTSSSGEKGAFVGPVIDQNHPDPIGEFVKQANLGIDGWFDEMGLEAAKLALTGSNVAAGGPNHGFLRENALLSIIVISDEDDVSPGLVSDYVNSFLAVKNGRSDAVLFSAIAGDVPGGCSSSVGYAWSGDRYYTAVSALNGAFESICAPDWANKLQAIGDLTFEALTKFTLEREPDLDSVVVLVTKPDGTVVEVPRYDPTATPPVFSGWSLDAENNVVFFGEAVPEAGAKIEVSYNVMCLAP